MTYLDIYYLVIYFPCIYVRYSSKVILIGTHIDRTLIPYPPDVAKLWRHLGLVEGLAGMVYERKQVVYKYPPLDRWCLCGWIWHMGKRIAIHLHWWPPPCVPLRVARESPWMLITGVIFGTFLYVWVMMYSEYLFIFIYYILALIYIFF